VADRAPRHPHEDVELFREAVRFTAARTRFAPRLIEKDYFCSLILGELAAAAPDMVFRGGTCLAKVHLGFYRLSEDLDFLVSIPVDSTRAERSRRAAPLRDAVARLVDRLPGLRIITPLRGANASRQYAATLGYRSLLAEQEETVEIEIGLREPLLMPVVDGAAKTLLLNPISGAGSLTDVRVTCVSRAEAMAEKLRAALSRRDVAIRDFYDIDHAVRQLDFRVDKAILGLLRRKLAVPGNDPVDVSAARLASLRQQLEAELRPVLRDPDFAEFDLDRAFTSVAKVAAALGHAVKLPRGAGKNTQRPA
jgi:predicted nucleotidyltransferase component of viral defense system